MWFKRQYKLPHIFVACFPKSGSTFLAKALQGLTGYPEYHAAEEYVPNEQDISRRKLLKARRLSVIQQHTKGTKTNLNILREFGMRPIVHVRNLFDVVVSLRDHFYGQDHHFPTGYVHREFWQLSERDQYDFLIQMHLPWYFNFLVSWHEAQRYFGLIMTSYEELFADPASTLRRLADFYGLAADDAAIERALDYAASQPTGFNKGISGRGRQMLTTAQRDAICRMAKVWQVDRKITRSVGIDIAEFTADRFPSIANPFYDGCLAATTNPIPMVTG
ncbi:MAG TPA: sulfotransferase domain-containing protein [Pirellulales bacterium]|nr:sulfotransferase domain-containing protein [Pirellulales bacterium]